MSKFVSKILMWSYFLVSCNSVCEAEACRSSAYYPNPYNWRNQALLMVTVYLQQVLEQCRYILALQLS